MNQLQQLSQFAQIYQEKSQQETLLQKQTYQNIAQFQTNCYQNYKMNQ